MTLHRLQLSGQLEGASVAPEGVLKYKREVLLCYEGEFESMDGPVVVTLAKLELIAQNYNAQLAKARETTEDGTIPDKFTAPLQLDHSDSAKETVGRNYDELRIAPYKKLDGTIVNGLYSETTFIGKENCKNGSNGIWAHVSIGADFESGLFLELTITPFPAAPEASLLSSKLSGNVVASSTYKGRKIDIIKNKNDFYACSGGKTLRVSASTAGKALVVAKEWVDNKRLTNGDGKMDEKAKCLKYMMDKKEMSKEKADEKYTKMSDEEKEKMSGDYKKMMEDTSGNGDEDKKKKMAAGDVSKMSAEEKEEVKKMAAAIDKDDEDKKKLAAEEDEDKKKLAAQEDEDKKKLAAAEEEDKKKLAAGDVTKMSEDDKGAFKKMMSFMSKLMGGDEDKDKDDKKLAAGDVSKMSADEKEEVKKMAADIKKDEEDKKELSKGDNKKKYMKCLMEDKDMEEDKAKEKMSKMSDEDIEKAVKKHEEERHSGGPGGPSKLAAGNRGGVRLSKADSDKITKLSKGFKSTLASTRLSVKKAGIVSRLSTLRSQAKITPAEIRKIEVGALAEKSQETINEVLKTYEQRQPVINANVFGTTKAMDISQLSAEVSASRLVQEEEVHLKNMPSLNRMKKNTEDKDGDTKKITKLSGVAAMDRMAHANQTMSIPLDSVTDEAIDKVQNDFDSMVKEGKLKEARKLMAKTFSDVKRLRSVHGAEFSDQDDRMKTIEDSIENLSEAFNSMLEIVNPILEK